MEKEQARTAHFNFQKLMTPAEVAETLGIKPETLTVWRCQKRYDLPFVRVGRSIMYNPPDVAEFIKRRTVGR